MRKGEKEADAGRRRAQPRHGKGRPAARKGPLPAARRGSEPVRPPPRGVDSRDLASLALLLKQRRLALDRTVRSSQEYWAGVHQVMELRAELAQAEGRFKKLYDFVPIPFLVLDNALRIVSANAAAAALCGLENVEPGHTLLSLLDPDDFREVATVLRAAGPPSPLEVRLRTAKGEVPAQVTAQAVDQVVAAGRGRGGARVYYLAIVDTSEVRRLQDERRALEGERRRSQEAERAARESGRAKDEFIAMLSHELRTPLTPVLAAVGTIDAASLPASTREGIALIRRNVLAEARLIDDLIDVARIRQGRLVVDRRPFSLHDLLTQVLVDWQPEAARRGLAVELARSASEDVVSADRGRMAQVLRNVLGNATKFSDPGGRVTVRTSDAEGRIRVTVTDTGTGMTSDQLERLFQTFAEARRPAHGRSGLGLGLAISRGIVEAHGGRIQVTSAGPGEGTTVEIELDLVAGGMPAAARPPVADFAAPPLPPPSRPAPQDGEKPRILLVEDHEDSAATLAMVLKIQGYRVKLARTVAEARGKVGDCDVLVSDISLPDGSGLDLLREARRHGDVKAIAVSGYGTEEDVRRSAEAGFAEHLVKPFDPERLIEAIERLGAPVVG
jgi:signal transduction histidine kinase